jgi:hypothetical protein
VALGTSLPADQDLSQWADGPLGELVKYVAELKASPEQLVSLGEVVADLRDRLPSELKEGPASMRLDAPETLRELLDQVEQLLVHQLLSREGGT